MKTHWIGIMGGAGSGKDHIAHHYLKPRIKGHRLCIGFGDMLKLQCISQNILSYKDIYGYPRHPDYREKLQKLGTEEGRDKYGERIWINMLDNLVSRLIAGGLDIETVIVTDVRFENELHFILDEKKGDILRIHAPNRCRRRQEDEQWSLLEMQHKSENMTPWIQHPCFYVIYNDNDDDVFLQIEQFFVLWEDKKIKIENSLKKYK